MRNVSTVLLSALLLGAGNASAGVVLNATHTDLATRQSGAGTVYIEADRLKMVTPETTMIYRADLNRMWAIDAQRRTYVEMTPESIQQMTAKLGAVQSQMAQLQAQLAQMPPEQRAMIEQMMGGRGLGAAPGAAPAAPPQIAYAKSGQNKTVAALRCDVYRKTVNGQQDEDACIAPIASAGLSAADFAVFDRFSAFMAPLLSSPMLPPNAYMSWNDMNRAIGFQGVPLDTVHYANGRPTRQETVTRIERASTPATAFELPAGLTKQEIVGR